MKTMVLRVAGMRCRGCARSVEMVLPSEPGVRRAVADVATGLVRVLCDPAVADGARLAAAVRSLGYEADPVDGRP